MEFEEFNKFESKLIYDESLTDNRPHIGLVLLNTDYSLEADWSKFIDADILRFTSRVQFNGKMDIDSLQNIKENIAQAAQLVGTGLDMDVIAFACTAASVVIGSKKIEELLNSGRTLTPATNPWLASCEAFKALNAKNIAVLAPYPTGVNHMLYKSLISEGFKVPVLGGMGLESDIEITKTSKKAIFDGLDKMLVGTKTDAIFMSCTNLRVLDYIAEIEEHFNLPVISSNQALFWHCLRLAKQETKISNAGILFEN